MSWGTYNIISFAVFRFVLRTAVLMAVSVHNLSVKCTSPMTRNTVQLQARCSGFPAIQFISLCSPRGDYSEHKHCNWISILSIQTLLWDDRSTTAGRVRFPLVTLGFGVNLRAVNLGTSCYVWILVLKFLFAKVCQFVSLSPCLQNSPCPTQSYSLRLRCG
jgi:hypothetical protein